MIIKPVNPTDFTTYKDILSQLIDVLETDISSSSTRKKYQHFVTGANSGPGVTSSLFQTVYDQDFNYQTSNAIFDVTVGIKPSGTIDNAVRIGYDTAGKPYYPDTTLMMREKTDNYSSYLRMLHGNQATAFHLSSDDQDTDAVLFIHLKRLFHRDSIRPGTFQVQVYQSASSVPSNISAPPDPTSNIVISETGSIYTSTAGQYSYLSKNAGTGDRYGNIYHNVGVIALDLSKIIDGNQTANGTIKSASDPLGYTTMTGKFGSDFMTSGSVDDIVDHMCSVRFSGSAVTAMTFQNLTSINSTVIYARALADEFNVSSNPTYTDSNGKIVVVDQNSPENSLPYSFITGVGLYDTFGNLLAVAKLSRPVKKTRGTELHIPIRIDF